MCSNFLSKLQRGRGDLSWHHAPPKYAPGFELLTVSLATFAASSVTTAVSTARENIRSWLFTLRSAFKTASLLIEQMKLVPDRVQPQTSSWCRVETVETLAN